MESDYFFGMILKVGRVFVVVAVVVWIGWRKVREKRRQNNLAMLAIVEAQKLKMKNEQGRKQDEGF